MKTIPLGFYFTAAILGCICSMAEGAVDSWEKIDNTDIAVFDERTGTPASLGIIAIDLPLHGDKGLPPVPGHMTVSPSSGTSISIDVFYDGLAADFPSEGSLDLHFQINPPAGLPSSGIAISGLETSGPFLGRRGSPQAVVFGPDPLRVEKTQPA